MRLRVQFDQPCATAYVNSFPNFMTAEPGSNAVKMDITSDALFVVADGAHLLPGSLLSVDVYVPNSETVPLRLTVEDTNGYGLTMALSPPSEVLMAPGWQRYSTVIDELNYVDYNMATRWQEITTVRIEVTPGTATWLYRLGTLRVTAVNDECLPLVSESQGFREPVFHSSVTDNVTVSFSDETVAVSDGVSSGTYAVLESLGNLEKFYSIDCQCLLDTYVLWLWQCLWVLVGEEHGN